MNDESLSALLDGECSPSELDAALAALERDPALRERFSRLVLAQEAGRGLRIRAANLDFAGRVAAGLKPEAAPGNVVPLWRRPGLAARTFVGLAAAASVAAVAVLALKPGRQAPATGPQTAAAPAGETVADAAHPVSPMDEGNAQLRNYLMTYSQSRAQHGVGGSLGYARYAAYTGQRPQPDGER
jgi:negative regulator of sigma E activity